MNLSIIGTGYVGLTTGACLSEMGHHVICVDVDRQKIANLKKGQIPIFEPGLAELVQKNLRQKRLSFETDTKKAINFAEVVFSAVGTPPGKDHEADLKYVKEVAESFGKYLNSYKIFINKSTVPVGTSLLCREIIEKELRQRKTKINFDMASNPEFLREGTAIKDTLSPDRIIIGLKNPHLETRAKKMLSELYKPFAKKKIPILFTDLKTAEIIKYASNAFLATKISFINEIANFCELAGGDVQKVAEGMGLDKRIGRSFLNAGIGYGGSCFPKDVKALIQTGKKFGYNFQIIKATENVNNHQKISLFHKLKKILPNLKNRTIGIWGLAFKPGTDDMREAPSIDLIKKLIAAGCKIKAYDPAATKNAKKIFASVTKKSSHQKLFFSMSATEAAKNADALLVLTEWDEFKKIDIRKIKLQMKNPIILDGRNFLSA